MTTQQWDVSGEASAALRAVVEDRGPAALSDPQLMNSLLRDFMPGSPREASILVAAAEADVAGVLRERATQQISTASAVAQAAALLEERTALAASACQWAARQIAEAIGMPPLQGPETDSGQPRPPTPPPTPAQPPTPPTTSPPTLPPTLTPPVSSPPSRPVPAPSPPRQRAPVSVALVAAGAALVCALSMLLQLLQPFPLGASYAWFLALSGVTLFGGAVLAFGGKSKYVATGVIFGAALSVVAQFIEESVASSGAKGILPSVLTTVAALVAAGAAAAYFAREGRLSGVNVRNPVAAAFCAAGIGYVIAFNPSWEQFQVGSAWLTPPGLIGPGVHGKFVFAGIVALAAIAIPVVAVGLLAPRTGARTGVLVGWLLVNLASLVSGVLTAAQPTVRAGSALYASGVLWVVAAVLGIVLLTSARPRQVGTAS